MTLEIPPANCAKCPRLLAFRQNNQAKYPAYHNAPVNSFGDLTPGGLAIIGLAPGLQGANQTGRPFTGDYAGDLLYATLKKFGFAKGEFLARADDGLALINCHIINAVRCVPPENKPTTDEIKTCGQYLKQHIEAIRPKTVLALGQIAHTAILRSLNLTLSHYKFGHGKTFELKNFTLVNSYHCSRYNTNTGVLTTPMFEEIFRQLQRICAQQV